MSQIEKAGQLFAALGVSVGFDAMGSDGQFTYRMNYADGLSINVDYMEELGKVVLAAPMLQLPSTNNVDAYVDLLELNLYYNELAGARFALLNTDKIIMLVRHVDVAAATPESFVKVTTAFIEAAGNWFDTLNGKFADEDAGVEDSAEGGFVKV